ncbi:MAG TPA: GNAT family N-acetyltransferase, partial [Galbitalea sp.]|nr:GNAT family N-acetyltransferase [Galbitalea sp.]
AYRDLVPAEYLEQMTVTTRIERWGNRIRSGDRSIFLAEQDGRVEGVVSFGERLDGLELMSLYVAAEARSSGLGSRLLEFALGNQAAVLWVFRDNSRAVAFYRRHRFELDGGSATDDDTGLVLVRMTRAGAAPWVE